MTRVFDDDLSAAFATRAIHAGQRPDPLSGAIMTPVYLTSTYVQGALGEHKGYEYARGKNPTREAFERNVAALEGGRHGFAFSSGMGCLTSLMFLLSSGDHVVCGENVYGGSFRLFDKVLQRFGLKFSYVDARDPQRVADAVTDRTRAILVETPTNPLMRLTDIAACAEIARRANALLMVDNTFASPVLQRPLELGCDVVLHSTTKYFGGHSDVQGGALVFARRGELHDKVHHLRHILGSVASPFNCWLVLRGLRTLACRVAAQSAGGLAVARALEQFPSVAAVHYPGLASHPGHDVARRQMSGFGAMLSFRAAGGREAALRAVSRARLFTRATSLGGVESLIEHRATSEGPASRTPQDLIRLSIGLEHPDDLIADLAQALGGPAGG